MNMSEELERLQSLYERGVLTAEEFARAKARLLDDPTIPAAVHTLNQLRRSRTDSVLGGVCGGLGRYTGIASWGWRVLFCASVICFGFGFLAYFLLWLFMPQEI